MSAPPNRQYIRRAPSSTNGKHHRDRNCSECVVWERETEGVRAIHTHTRHTNSHEMSTYFANHCSTAYAANENVFGSVIYTREEEEKIASDESARREQSDLVTLSHTPA